MFIIILFVHFVLLLIFSYVIYFIVHVLLRRNEDKRNSLQFFSKRRSFTMLYDRTGLTVEHCSAGGGACLPTPTKQRITREKETTNKTNEAYVKFEEVRDVQKNSCTVHTRIFMNISD